MNKALELLRAAQAALVPYMRVIPGTGEPGVLNEAGQMHDRIRAHLDALPAQADAEQEGIMAGLNGYVGTHNPHLFRDAVLRDAWERGNARVRAMRDQERKEGQRVAESFAADGVEYATSHLALRDLLNAMDLQQRFQPPVYVLEVSKFDVDKARAAYDLVEGRRVRALGVQP